MASTSGAPGEYDRRYAPIAARARADAAFKQRLLSDPVAALRAEGWALPEGVQVHITQDAEQLLEIALPGAAVELSDHRLEQVAGGGTADAIVPFLIK